MPAYMRLGSLPPKRHMAHPNPSGGYREEGIYYEEVVTTAGFGRAYSICYHLRPPTRVRKIEPAGEIFLQSTSLPVLRHVHLLSGNIKPAGDAITGRVPLFANADVILGRCRPIQPQKELYRNGSADEVIFVHRGQ